MSRPTFLKIWLFVVVAALSFHLGKTPLLDPDEGRNGEVGREMAATNNYVIPRLDGMPYLDKPVLYFTVEAACMKLFGPTEFAARLPALFFTILTAAILFWFGRRVLGEEEAHVAAIVFLSMPLTFSFARTVIFDSALTFFIVGGLIAFYFAIDQELEASGSWWKRKWSFMAWAAIGLGVLTKGPVAIAVPLLVVIPYALKRRAFRALWSLGGFAIFFIIVGPWVWAISQIVPDFLHYVLVTETFQRLTTESLKRTGPPWYFLPYLIGGALPWSLFFIHGRGLGSQVRGAEGRSPAILFFWLWLLIPFVFFSLSQSKRPQYIVPILPALALLVAAQWTTERRWVGVRLAAIIFFILGLALFVFPLAHLKIEPLVEAGARASAIPLAITTLCGAAAFFIKRREFALAALTIPIIALPLATEPIFEAMGARRSAKSFVEQIAGAKSLIGLRDYTGSIQFYVRKPILVITPDAKEFTSNYIAQHYDVFANDPNAPIRRPFFLDREATYITRSDDGLQHAMLEKSGFRVIASAPYHIAYAARPAALGE